MSAEASSMVVAESGPASAPTVVFLHGGGVGGWMWRPQVADLQADYHCLVPDLPEHGLSAGLQPFTINDAAARVAALINRRAHDGRAHLVGLSLGGQVAVATLALAGGLLDRVLVSGVLTRPLPGAGLIQLSVQMYGPLKNWTPLIEANRRSLGVPPGYAAEFAADTRRASAAALGRVLQANAAFRVPPGLERLRNPVLVLVGEKEPRLMRRSARELSAALLNGTAQMVRGQVHNWSLTSPALFNRVLRAWLAGADSPDVLLPVPRR